jgi:hypothetical protein
MKSKSTSSPKKPAIVVKDLKASKNPKGGASINTSRSNIKHPGLADANSAMQGVSTTR